MIDSSSVDSEEIETESGEDSGEETDEAVNSEFQEIRKLLGGDAGLADLEKRLSAVENKLNPPKAPKGRLFSSTGISNQAVFSGAIVCALILALTAFLLIKAFQWRTALNALRAEPGIEILSVRSGLMKREVIGLRDPLSPNPRTILEDHNIKPDKVDLRMTSFHSLNTPYGRHREEEMKLTLDEIRENLIKVVGTFSEDNRQQREQELSKLSQVLLEMRFPDLVERMNLHYKEGVWHADGDLSATEYELFKSEAPKYVFNGVMDFENLTDFTAAKASAIKRSVEAYNLLDRDFQGEHLHVSRIARLIKDYDEICRKTNTAPGQIVLTLRSENPAELTSEIDAIKLKLTSEGHFQESRISFAQDKPKEDQSGEDHLSLALGE